MSFISGLLGNLIEPVTSLIGKFQDNKITKEQLTFEIATLAERHSQEIALAQIEVNKEEAKGNWFQSSWRPACAWVCVAGFTVNFLISPLSAPFGIVIPMVDITTMMPVLLGMLGLGGLRTFEKTKGVNK